MSGDDDKVDHLVIRHLRTLREDLGKRFDDVDGRLVKIEGTLKDLTVGLRIAARLTKLEVDVAKLKRAGGHK